jgi:hypothetical protein
VDSEIITLALVAASSFHNHHERALCLVGNWATCRAT